MATTEVVLTSAWDDVFDGSTDNVIIQVSGMCLMQVGGSDPGVSNVGIKLREKPEGSGYEFAASNMLGVSVWLKEASGESNVVATVATW